ncbi:ABC transporter permease [Fulvivirgaceae bacterium PWU5]|uniref:ABC transporter permease n=1 Tax=Dawidia cretensis TaxID=2782350 RepID=A0AAP2E251_9BACT|nr:ABC transporter permease [Dawidia cretensis]MBT1711651.1 ABC transporter permease [Dawidia cretensis]
MLKNYFIIAWRSLLRNKIYTVINITGLAVGLCCCLLITLYIREELSYDQYHEHAPNIYRVLQSFRSPEKGARLQAPAPGEYQVWGCAPVGPALREYYPEVQHVTQFTSPNTMLLERGDRRFQENNITFADSATFDIFSWKLLEGNPALALKELNGIVLTKSLARKYFGEEAALGQMLRVDNNFQVIVTGVMEDIPANSHFSFDAFISMNTFRKFRPEIFGWWGYVDFYTYFRLPENARIKKMEARTSDFAARNVPDGENGWYAMTFEPLSDAYLYSKAGRQPGVTGSLSNVYIFASVAVFILLIACINFMNLSTARSMERAKEVGVRKTVGALRRSLVYQFLTESVILSFISAFVAVVLALIALPLVQELSAKTLGGPAAVKMVLPWVLFAASVIGLLAGSYPALVLSGFRPAAVLKGKFKASTSGVLLRKGLVVVQFSLSIALMAGTAVVLSQLDHMRSSDLGFEKDQMLVIDYGGDADVNKKIEAIKDALGRHPAVKAASASRAVPGTFFPNAHTEVENPSGEMQAGGPSLYEIDFDFVPTYGIEMAAGRAYSRNFQVDSTQTMLLNEAAAKLYGYANPADIIGRKFSQWGREGVVVGVVKDFHYQSLHRKVEPLALRLAPNESLNNITVKIEGGNYEKTIAELQAIWKTVAPQRPFLYTFLDQSFGQQYKADVQFTSIFGIFAGLTIFIACLGLFGLATYATEQRVKEIGIRKVLGASVAGIAGMLSSDFLKLVVVSMLIAIPASWWAMSRWLETFPYRVSLSWWMFALAAVLALIIALVTVSFKAIRAAMISPISSLRSE